MELHIQDQQVPDLINKCLQLVTEETRIVGRSACSDLGKDGGFSLYLLPPTWYSCYLEVHGSPRADIETGNSIVKLLSRRGICSYWPRRSVMNEIDVAQSSKALACVTLPSEAIRPPLDNSLTAPPHLVLKVLHMSYFRVPSYRVPSSRPT